MDRVRQADVLEFTDVVTVELFPNVSIGDAPELENPQGSVPAENVPTSNGAEEAASK